ncbi:MAG TPA: phosphopantetheine-binding protein, partial [Thermoanaerobaculia bacterium]
GAPFTDRSSRVLDAAEWARLKERAAGAGLTTSSLLVAAFTEALALWALSPRFTLALVGTYRPPFHPQMYDIVGNFNTLLALAVDSADGSFADHARRIQDRLREGIDHWHYPGVRVLRELKRRHAPDSRAAVPVVFNSLLEFNQRKPEAPGERRPASPARFRDGSLWVPQILLLVTADEFGDGALYCRMQGREELLAEGYVEGLYAGYIGLLRALASGEGPWQADRERLARLLGAPRWPEVPPDLPAVSTRPSEDGRQADELEHRLAAIWADILGQRPPGPEESFFELGGDSLSLVLMMNRVETELGPGPRLLGFFDDPTVRGLARLLRQRA